MKRSKRLLISMLTLLCCTGVWATGELNGLFTINASGDKVQFSQGNLQATYDGSAWSWAFAENQWDYIGGRTNSGSEPQTGNNYINGNGTVSTNGTVDLFGWSTSETVYGIYNSLASYLYSGDFVDWGNTIGMGWRTLTIVEWGYLFNTRSSGSTVNGTSDARYTHATINTDGTGVNGIILFPDGVTIDNSEATSWGTVNGTSAWGTKCTTAQWTALAAKGCVFLPAAGQREGTTIWNAGSHGYYYSSSYDMSNEAYALYMDFFSNNLNTLNVNGRYHGYSVRLVKKYRAQTTSTSGELNGLFTINASDDRVLFSQGNLQYFCSTTAPEWRFAENQYDYVAFDISAYAANSEKWIDLFAHGTSGYDNGQTNYQPYIVGAGANTYYQGNLTGNADWGYNAISNGGNTVNIGWRTLTRDEWNYLFSGRSNAASKYGHGSINGINGMILLPDNWTLPDGLSFTPGNSAWTNSYNFAQWTLMENAGAVFLPASGSCNSTGIPGESLQNQNGFYRASTAAYYMHFRQGSLENCTNSYYQYGDAVRLVKDYALNQDGEGNYLIGSAKDLKEFAAFINSGGNPAVNAKLTADIDLAGDADNQWTPIGKSANRYNGTFDGQGFTIKNLYYKQQVQAVGLFGIVNSSAYIKNVRVEGLVDNSIDGAGGGSSATQTCAGGIIGMSYGATVLNCSFSGSVISYSNVGGIVGWGTATIVNCYNEGTVMFHSTKSQAGGGVHGYDGSPQLINCYNVGDIINNGSATFAIGSLSNSGSVSNCYSRSECVQNGNGASWTNAGKYGTAMSLDDMKAEAFVTTLNTNVASLRATYPDISEWMQDPVTNLPVLKVFAALKQDGEGNYLIGSVQNWKDFATLIQTTPTGNAKMTADIDLGTDQTMIGSGTSNPDNDGSSNIKYQGTFDGQGHTLTIHYVAEDNITAPFRFIQEATIKNLRVDGDITTAYRHAGGIVGTCFGQQKHSYIENCISSVNIISSYVNNSDFYAGAWHGGIAARLHYYGQLHITDCIFNGSISGENKKVVWGGMLGIPDGMVTITNCLQVGTFDCSDVIVGSNGSGTMSTVFATGYASHVNIVNCHFLNALGTVQGTQATTTTLSDGTVTTALNAGRSGDDAVWVQDPLTNQPILKLFAKPVLASGYCGVLTVNNGKDVRWTLTEDGVLTISGTGAMANYAPNYYTPWKDYSSSITSVVIGNGVTRIGSYAFGECTSLTSVTIGSGVTRIEEEAFYGCTSLTSVTIPNAVTSINSYAFYGCTSLTSLTIGSGVTDLMVNAFNYCSELATITVDVNNPNYDSRNDCNAIIATASNALVLGCKGTTIPDDVTCIGYFSFAGSGLTSITIPSCVTNIESRSFEGSGLTSITIPASVTNIDNNPFSYCSELATIIVDGENPKYDSRNNCNAIIETASNKLIAGCKGTTIPDDVTSIGLISFQGSGLTSITIPASVISIEIEAFSNNKDLTTVTLNGNPYIHLNAFYGLKDDLTVTMNLTANGPVDEKYWMTFYNQNHSFEADANTQVFKAALSDNKISLTELTADKIVKMNNAVILKSTANPIVMTLTKTNSSNDFTGNQLAGVSNPAGKTADDPSTTYVLSNGSQGVGFYKFAPGSTLGVGKAYLTYSGVGAPSFFGFGDGETTSISTTAFTDNTDKVGVIYDLQGRKVANPSKGLYILNGKKRVIK